MNRRHFLFGVAGLSVAGATLGQGRLRLVAVLSSGSLDSPAIDLVNRPFKEALAKLGYRPGQTIELVERFSKAMTVVCRQLRPSWSRCSHGCYSTNTSAAAEAAARATRTIPIVVGPAGEFVLKELAGGTLARPTTNVTGLVLTSPEIDNKSIALLLEAAPTVHRVGVLVDPSNPGMKSYPSPQLTALGRPDVAFTRIEASGLADIDAAMRQAVEQRVDAIFVTDDPHIAANPVVRDHTLRFAASA